MKERLITLGTALAALALAVFLLAPPEPPPARVSLPTSEDRGGAGLKGLYTWLQRERVPVASLRNRYTELHRLAAQPQRGNLLLASLPARTDISKAEWQALKQWIAEGNTLLILGAVYNRPDWANGETCFCQVKALLSDFSWSLDVPDAAESLQETEDPDGQTLEEKVADVQAGVKAQIPIEDRLLPVSRHPLLAGVGRLETQTVPVLLDQTWWLATEDPDNLALGLLQRSDGKAGAFWQIKAGEGQILLSLAPDLFSNARLGRADNARFIANLIGQALAGDGKLIFDDYHFGLSELYDPERFFADTRLHQTLGFMGLLWLLYVIGHDNRLAPVRAPSVRLSAQDYIDATAGFFARRLKPRTLAAELAGQALLDVRSGRRLRDETQTWLWLERHPQITAGQLDLLKRAHARRPVSLVRLADAITHIRAVSL
jgi:hypothetical protein